MATNSSRALVKRSADTQLMPPPPKRIKRPRKVIEEDEYTSAISEIIARDFFPGLLESETQQEYLDAVESKDEAWISSSSRRLHQIMTPGRHGRRGTSMQTPREMPDTPRGGYGGDTPMSVVSNVSMNSNNASTREAIDTNMSLSAFQAKYTSEDNESFYKLLDKQNQKRAEKYAWIWRGNKLPSKMMLKQKEIEMKLLESGRSVVDDGGVKDRLAIKDKDEKPAAPEGWKSKPNNQFMFEPDSVEDSVQTVAQRSQEESRAAPKAVAYNNTRLPPPQITQDNVPPSPSLTAIQDAIAGKPRGYSESGFGGSETPRVNGYAFVDDEPDEYIPPAVAIRLPTADPTPNPFKMQEQSAREDLHHRLVDRNASQKRDSSRLGMTGKIRATPTPTRPYSTPSARSSSLTPAAQRLWSKVGQTPRLPSSSNSIKTPTTMKDLRQSVRRKHPLS